MDYANSDFEDAIYTYVGGRKIFQMYIFFRFLTLAFAGSIGMTFYSAVSFHHTSKKIF